MSVSADAEIVRCTLCERNVPRRLITLHHLKPRQKGGKAEDRRPLCKPCHKQLHATFSNAQLAKYFGTLDALRAAPELAAFLAWIRRQNPERNFATAVSDAHPHSRRMRRRW